MSDENLRKLERRWKETGSVEDEAAWLRERIRLGELKPESISLAAYCQHISSQIALEDECPEIPDSIVDWVNGLGSWGHEVCVRTAIAVAKMLISQSDNQYSQEPTPQQLINAAVDWLNCPCEEHRKAAGDLGWSAALAHVQSQDPVWSAVSVVGYTIQANAGWASWSTGTYCINPKATRRCVQSTLISWALGLS